LPGRYVDHIDVTKTGAERNGRPHVTTAVARDAALTAADRCDRCGAQAYLRVELPGGGELLFCAHHARKHGDKLSEVALNIHDETDRLADTPSTAPAEEF
jgi:hypothetical protein